MTVAVESRHPRTDSPRRRGTRPETTSKPDSAKAAAVDLPVLFRLPNLETPRTDVSPAAPPNAEPPEQHAAQQRPSVAADRPPAGLHPIVSLGTRIATNTSVTASLMAWAWRLAILATAVGLVILAYRIINGPGEASLPTVSDEISTSARVEDVEAETAEAHPHEHEQADRLPPDETPPSADAPHSQHASADAEPADHDVSEHAPPRRRLPANGPDRAERIDPPIGFAEGLPKGTLHNEAVAEDSHSGAGNDWPVASPDQARHSWESEYRHTEESMVPPQDSPRQNARWERSYDDHYNGGDQYGDGGRAFDHPRAAMHDRPAETYAEPTGEWHSGASEPAATGRAYPPQDDSYHYPETTRDSWRDERGWDAAPNEYSPHRDSTGVVPRWEQGSRSASRSGQPGVARLHGDIEQPPLRRADERDRPSVY